MGFADFLSPGLTAATQLATGYQTGQAQGRKEREAAALRQIATLRQQHNDEIKNALTSAQTKQITDPQAKPKRSTATFKVKGKATLGSMDESGTYYDGAGNPVTDGLEPFEKAGAQQHVVDPVTGEVKFFDPKAPPAGLKVHPAPRDPQIVQGTGPDGQPHVFRVPKAGGDATEVGGLTPKAAGAGGGRGAATIQKALAKNQQMASVIDDAMKELDAYPNAVGLTRGLPIVGDRLDQRADPKGVAARASIANIGSLQIHDRTGAAMTIHEEPRLAPFVPNVNDTPEAIRTKLRKLRAALQVETDALGGGHAGAPAPAGGAASHAQSLWDAAVAKHGEQKVLAEFGPRPNEDEDE